MSHSVQPKLIWISHNESFILFFPWISFSGSCMKVLGPRALNKTLSTAVHCAVLHFDEWRRWGDLWKRAKKHKKNSNVLLKRRRHFSLFMKTVFSLSAVLTTCSRLGVFYCWLAHTVSVFCLFTPRQSSVLIHTNGYNGHLNPLNQASRKCSHRTRALFTADLYMNIDS